MRDAAKYFLVRCGAPLRLQRLCNLVHSRERDLRVESVAAEWAAVILARRYRSSRDARNTAGGVVGMELAAVSVDISGRAASQLKFGASAVLSQLCAAEIAGRGRSAIGALPRTASNRGRWTLRDMDGALVFAVDISSLCQ